jgi:signal transduction histidine kinase/CheY-like chemotaxis protein
MMTACNLMTVMMSTVLCTAFYLAWWFYLAAFVVAMLGVFLYFRGQLNQLKHERAEQESALHQRSELLSFSKRNEQIAREDAQYANANKRLLLSQISHDIRTPMTAVMGMASLLNETPLNAEQHEYAATILHSGEILLGLINDILMKDILEYAKVETGRELDVVDFDLRTSIEDVFDVFAAKAAHMGLDLVYGIEKNIPAYVACDKQRLRQILMNMVENAVKFTRKGEVYIGVTFIEMVEENRIKLEFEVRDTGAGMSQIKTREIAKELQQTNQPLKTDGKSGVGLVICKNLIMLMGGTISVESVENEGTSFRFCIPLRTNTQPLRPPVSIEMEGKTVLLVDNNPTVVQMLETQLAAWNMKTIAALNGDEALVLLAKHNDIDLVLTDYEMPNMDGVELAKAIKAAVPAMPVILLNKMGDVEHKKHPQLFSNVINKPVKQHVLNEQILSTIRQMGKVVSINHNPAQKLSPDFAKQYPLRILIAEDNLMNQKIVTKVLNKLGYQPKITNNGKEVLEEISETFYDLILMDIQMPKMNGLEATKMIRVCLANQPIIIAMTANTLQGDREECLEAGMDDYICKPVNLDELVQLLEKWAIHSNQKI